MFSCLLRLGGERGRAGGDRQKFIFERPRDWGIVA